MLTMNTHLVIDMVSIHHGYTGPLLRLTGDGLRHPLEDEEVEGQHGEPVGQPPGTLRVPVGGHPQPGQAGLLGLDVELQPPDTGAFMLNSRSSLRPSSTPRICQESSMSPFTKRSGLVRPRVSAGPPIR